MWSVARPEPPRISRRAVSISGSKFRIHDCEKGGDIGQIRFRMTQSKTTFCQSRGAPSHCYINFINILTYIFCLIGTGQWVSQVFILLIISIFCTELGHYVGIIPVYCRLVKINILFEALIIYLLYKFIYYCTYMILLIDYAFIKLSWNLSCLAMSQCLKSEKCVDILQLSSALKGQSREIFEVSNLTGAWRRECQFTGSKLQLPRK